MKQRAPVITDHETEIDLRLSRIEHHVISLDNRMERLGETMDKLSTVVNGMSSQLVALLGRR